MRAMAKAVGIGKGVLPRLVGSGHGAVGTTGTGSGIIGAKPRKLGKEWVLEAYARRRDELRAMSITDAGRLLAKQSRTALDSGRALSARYCENVLRTTGDFPKKPRK